MKKCLLLLVCLAGCASDTAVSPKQDQGRFEIVHDTKHSTSVGQSFTITLLKDMKSEREFLVIKCKDCVSVQPLDKE